MRRLFLSAGVCAAGMLAPLACAFEIELLGTNMSDALLAAAERAASAVDALPAGGTPPSRLMLDDAARCLRDDMALMVARKRRGACDASDYLDPCVLDELPAELPDAASPYDERHVGRLLPAAAFARTLRVIAHLDGALAAHRLGGSGPVPALVHQTWKSGTVNATTSDLHAPIARYINSWEDASWSHALWTDARLHKLVELVAPWLAPTLARLPARQPVRKIDTMRYLLVFVFGGVYLDADDARVSGALHGVFGALPSARGAAVSPDPHVIAAAPHHPALLQMLLWIVARADGEVWGALNALTGPDGWRRVVGAYRRCESSHLTLTHVEWPTFVFNSKTCGCWGNANAFGELLVTNLTIPFRPDIELIRGARKRPKCIGNHMCRHVYKTPGFTGGQGLRKRRLGCSLGGG